MIGKIYAIGMGPGSAQQITPQATMALQKCEVVAGYTQYLRIYPKELWEGKEIIKNGMKGELQRCIAALDACLESHNVAMICSGDAGIYAMAGLLLELINHKNKYKSIEIEVIPGVTAANAAAALLGAPLMNDYLTLSLSDLLTPLELIHKRIECAAEADLVVAVYNPSSRRRKESIKKLVDTYTRVIGPQTPVGIVHHATRPDQAITLCTLENFPFEEIGMSTLVIIGNSYSVIKNGKFYTQRGYLEKYDVPRE